jgi:hypothetical protein
VGLQEGGLGLNMGEWTSYVGADVHNHVGQDRTESVGGVGHSSREEDGVPAHQARARLAECEERFGISSPEFERRQNGLEMTEAVELSDWRLETGMLRHLESRYQALEEAQLA